MGASLSVFVLLSLSVLVIRVASVALRLTGLDERVAKFQALSAFSGTGFASRETESIVNYPLRRQIVVLLMVVGNLGLVSVLATLVASFIQTDGKVEAVLTQLLWLAAGLFLIWFLILNKKAERFMCGFIGRILDSTTFIGKRNFYRLLQVSDEYSVCEHPVVTSWVEGKGALGATDIEWMGLVILSVRTMEGKVIHSFSSTSDLKEGDILVLYGLDAGHEILEKHSR